MNIVPRNTKIGPKLSSVSKEEGNGVVTHHYYHCFYLKLYQKIVCNQKFVIKFGTLCYFHVMPCFAVLNSSTIIKPRYNQCKKSGGKVIRRGNVILLDLKIILIASVLLSTLSMNIFCIVDRPTLQWCAKWKDIAEDDIADSLCYDSESFFAHSE